MEFQPTDLCKECKGRCCKAMPGSLSPADVNPLTVENVTAMLTSGKYAIDWYDGFDENSEGYYLRPSVKGSRKIYDPSWGGECTFLKKNGCSLKFEDRPWNCRIVKPADNLDDECGSPILGNKNSKYEAASLWMKSWSILHAAARAAEKK